MMHKKTLYRHTTNDIRKGRNYMKKIAMLLMSALVIFVLAACGKTNDATTDNVDNDPVMETDKIDQTESDRNRDKNNANSDTIDNGVDHNGESRLDLADDAADRVAELDEVDTATVILSNRNAYVAVMMNNDKEDISATKGEDELSKDLEDKISDKVKEVKTDVENVYVSLNPDFVERMKGYGTRIQEGEPIEGFFDEFTEAVRNVFPDAH